ncbi:MAG: site-2 protease family protein [Candidatus Zixiibacteriota bacterium]|nr:MAG: site-2 protease family protein [candidate division Zixibacteria bacterium]
MFGEDFWQRAIVGAPVILFSLTVHEYFHAWTANRFGDPTAKNLGRLTLNPLAHLDLMGTLMMVFSKFQFGWAKPVPVNPANLRNLRVADIWISIAGPLSNFGLALLAGLLFRTVQGASIDVGEFGYRVLRAGVAINIFLAFLNMIPLFPLDGSHVLKNLVSPETAERISRLDPFAPILLILLVVSGVFWTILGPPAFAVIRMILGQ